jgi:carbon storage regulator
MLVLSRHKDESIMVGENVEVMIVDIRGNEVRLGITASRYIPVHRKEVYKAIHRKKAEKTK